MSDDPAGPLSDRSDRSDRSDQRATAAHRAAGLASWWCAACGYDFRGLPEGVERCPECGADASDRGRRALYLVDVGLALLTWGLPVVGLAWVGTLAVKTWSPGTANGNAGLFRPERPMWVAFGVAAMAAAFGPALIARTIPVGRWTRPVMIAMPVLFAVLMALMIGFQADFPLGGAGLWPQVGPAYRVQYLPLIVGVLTAGVAAMALSRVAVIVGMRRTASVLTALAWIGTAATLGGLVANTVLEAVGQSLMKAAYLAAQEARAAQAPRTAGAASAPVQVHWFWNNGVRVCWSLLYAWGVMFAAGLWLGAVAVRARVREEL